MNCADILTGSGFIPVNRAIAQKLKSVIAAAMLGHLTRWRETYRIRDDLDDFGGFYALSEQIEKELFVNKSTRLKYQKLLVQAGFLKVVKRGAKGRNNCFINHYYIQDKKIIDCIYQDSTTSINQKLVGVQPKIGRGTTKKQPGVNQKVVVNKNKSKNKSKKISEGIHPQVVKLFFDQMKEMLNGEKPNFNARMGKEVKKIISLADSDLSLIQMKIRLYLKEMKKDKFLQSRGFSPSTVLEKWNTLKVSSPAVVQKGETFAERRAKFDKFLKAHHESA